MASPPQKGITAVPLGLETAIETAIATAADDAVHRQQARVDLCAGFEDMIRQSCAAHGDDPHGLDMTKLASDVAAVVERATANASSKFQPSIIKELARGSIRETKRSEMLTVDKMMWKKMAFRAFGMLVVSTFTIFGLMIWALELQKEVAVSDGFLTAADGKRLIVQTDRPAGSLGEIFDLPADQLGTITRVHFVSNDFSYFLDITSIVKNPTMGDVEMHAADGSLLFFRHKVQGANFQRELLFVPSGGDEPVEVPLELVSSVGRRLRALTDDADGGYDSRGNTAAGTPEQLAFLVAAPTTLNPAAPDSVRRLSEGEQLLTCCDVFEGGPNMCKQACYVDTCQTLYELVEVGAAFKIRSLCEDNEETEFIFSELKEQYPNVPADRAGLWVGGTVDEPQVVLDKNDAAVVTMAEDGSYAWGGRRLQDGTSVAAVSAIAVVQNIPSADPQGRRLGERRLGAFARFQSWASGTTWCGAGTDKSDLNTPCPGEDPARSADVPADLACRRHDHAGRFKNIKIGVKGSCDGDKDLSEAVTLGFSRANVMIQSIFGATSLAAVWGCYDYGTHFCIKWVSKWWGGYPVMGNYCHDEHTHYGPWRFQNQLHRYGYESRVKTCTGDLYWPGVDCPGGVSCPN